MGMGECGLLLIVIVDHSLIPCVKRTSKVKEGTFSDLTCGRLEFLRSKLESLL